MPQPLRTTKLQNKTWASEHKKRIKKELSICQSFLCLDLCAMMMTMTTLAEDVSNSSRQTSPRTVKKNGASLIQEVSSLWETAKERVNLHGNAADLLGMRHCQPSLAHTTAVTNDELCQLLLRPCLQGWTDRVCEQYTLP